MVTFRQLRQNLKQDTSNLPCMKAALVGDTSTQFLGIALKGMAIQKNMCLDLYEADYNQIEQQLLSQNSQLLSTSPRYVIVFQSLQKLWEQYASVDDGSQILLFEQRIAFVAQICESLPHINLVYFNYPELPDGVFGNYASKVPRSFSFQVKKLNYELMLLAQQKANLHILDFNALYLRYGLASCFDFATYTSTDMALSIDILPKVSAECIGIMSALEGRVKKCLILDLDNTLWGGIIGDDGLGGIQIGHGLGIGGAFTNFQLWIKQLAKRGIIICVCSKNNDAVARLPFEQHREMVLQLQDIAVFVANWNNKADNIRYIQRVLNIGFDSMVFIDDSSFERNLVRENLPEVTVPEMPEDPSLYVDYLVSLNLFETASYSELDKARNEQYRTEAARQSALVNSTDESAFLRGLDMVAVVEGFTEYSIPRVAQLSQRSNQFNLRTVRYMEADVMRLASDKRYHCFSFSLSDKYGDYGLVSVVVLDSIAEGVLFIDTLLMSCRVLKRTMEGFVLNSIVAYAKSIGCHTIIGEYIPTKKNVLVENLYPDWGFVPLDGYQNKRYQLDVHAFADKTTFIKLKQHE